MSYQGDDPEQLRRAYYDAQRELDRDEQQKEIYKRAIREARREEEAEKARKRLIRLLLFFMLCGACLLVCLLIVYAAQRQPKTQLPKQPVNSFSGSPMPDNQSQSSSQTKTAKHFTQIAKEMNYNSTVMAGNDAFSGTQQAQFYETMTAIAPR